MNKIKIAVIGAGHLGTIHTRLLNQNDRFDLVGVVDPQESARQKITTEFNVPAVQDFKELGDPIDAAVIAASTHHHYGIAQRLLDKGIHLLIEKPITITVQEADHLNQLAAKNDVMIQVGHNERFNATFEAAKKSHSACRYIEAARTSTYTFRSTDVGVVLDLMIHDLDLVLSLVQSPIAKVDAVGTSVFGGHEDIAQARIQFANGCVANLTASRCSFERQRWIRWFSEDGFVSANLDANQVQKISIPDWLRKGERDVNELPAEKQAEIRDNLFKETLPLKATEIKPVNAIELEHNDFYDSIQLDRQPRVNGVAGRDALAAAEAVLDSIAAHEWRQLPKAA